MVVQIESELPEEIKIQKNTLMDPKKYIVFKNHVREIQHQPAEEIESANVIENTNKETKTPKNKRCEQRSFSLQSSQVNKSISTEDLEELKTVYKKCKSVVAKIERKYGHLLDLNDPNEHTNFKRRKLNSNDHYYHECGCASNKKIIFTEDGEQKPQVGQNLENHICNRNNPNYKENICNVRNSYENIEIDYESVNPTLPETIQELTEILKDPLTAKYLRKKVIEKIKYLRHENLNTIRFNKESLIKQLKSNPEEILNFKGTNISTLVGYPTK